MELKHNDKTYIRQYENHQTELISYLILQPHYGGKGGNSFQAAMGHSVNVTYLLPYVTVTILITESYRMPSKAAESYRNKVKMLMSKS